MGDDRTSHISLTDVIQAVYGLPETGAGDLLSRAGLDAGNTALLLIDVQGLVSPEYMARVAIRAGLPEQPVHAALADYADRFYPALRACSQLLQAARMYRVPPIHVKMQSLTTDGRDTNRAYRMLGWSYPSDGEATEFLLEVAPQPGEMVLTKTVGGAFAGTMLDRVLCHMSIKHLFACGFVTDECVETTLREALDHGYLAALVRDASAAYTADAHAYTVGRFSALGLTPAAAEVVAFFEQFAGH
jgi:nicotinamidase-related amidase